MAQSMTLLMAQQVNPWPESFDGIVNDSSFRTNNEARRVLRDSGYHPEVEPWSRRWKWVNEAYCKCVRFSPGAPLRKLA